MARSNALRSDAASEGAEAPAVLTAVPALPERMAVGERRCVGDSEAMRKAKTTIFTRHGQAGDTLADVESDFDAMFGKGGWNSVSRHAAIVSVRGEAIDDLEYLYAVELPNKAVDALCRDVDQDA